jgi:hypothetical protein
MKEKNMAGELISIEDIDKAMAEQAVLHKTDIVNSEKIFPNLLENLEKSEIVKILKDQNQQRLESLDALIKKEFKCEETLYEVIIEVLEKLKEEEPIDIINKIKR